MIHIQKYIKVDCQYFIIILAIFSLINCTKNKISSIEIIGVEPLSTIILIDYFTKDTLSIQRSFDTILDLTQIVNNSKKKYKPILLVVENNKFKCVELIPFIKNESNKVNLNLEHFDSDYESSVKLSGNEDFDQISIFNPAIEKLKASMYQELNKKEIDLSSIDSLAPIIDSLSKLFIINNPKNVLSKIFVLDKIKNDADYFLKNKNLLNVIDSVCKKDGYFLNEIDLCVQMTSIKDVDDANSINESSFYLKANDTYGDRFVIDSIQNKYVIVDFWATWCKPCLKEIEMTIDRLNSDKYNEVEVIFISIDNDVNKWKRFIPTFFDTSKNFHLIDFSGLTKDYYEIKSIPHNFLLNKNKEIIGKNVRGENLFSTLDIWLKND